MTVDFSYVISGLDITLTNLSEGYVTSMWEVKANGQSIETSVVADEYSFTADGVGFYQILLTIQNTSETLTKGIEVYLLEVDEQTVFFSILKQVDFILPGILEKLWEAAENYKVKWQTILFPSLIKTQEVPLDIASEHLEQDWPYFWNSLIAQLIVRDILLDMEMAIAGINPTSTGGGGPIKKITTGPVDTEWFSNIQSLDYAFKDGGLLSEINKRICSMASNINILFSFCKGAPFFPIVITPTTDVKIVNTILKYGSSYVLSTFYT